jgi:ribosome-associated protein
LENLSRTKKKRAAEALQVLGEQLVQLDDTQVGALDLPVDLKEALLAIRRFKSHGARRRQLQYIGRLMRSCDHEAIEQALQKTREQEDQNRRRFKLVERWRNDLVNGDEERLTWLLERFPTMDQEQLHQLVNCARGASTQINAKEASRKLFRFLSRLDGLAV